MLTLGERAKHMCGNKYIEGPFIIHSGVPGRAYMIVHWMGISDRGDAEIHRRKQRSVEILPGDQGISEPRLHAVLHDATLQYSCLSLAEASLYFIFSKTGEAASVIVWSAGRTNRRRVIKFVSTTSLRSGRISSLGQQ